MGTLPLSVVAYPLIVKALPPRLRQLKSAVYAASPLYFGISINCLACYNRRPPQKHIFMMYLPCVNDKGAVEMPNSSKPRKKKTSKTKAKSNTNPIQTLPEYYSVTFLHVTETHVENMQKETNQARAALISPYQEKIKRDQDTLLTGDEAWDTLHPLMEIIEEKIKDIISKHSLFFWFHLYRRVAPQSIAEEYEKSDAGTISTVRLVLETAFFKYAKSFGDDICLSNTLSEKEVLGGYFYEAHSKGGMTPDTIKKVWELYQSQPQWVLKEYSPDIQKSIYILEGYAYEYWRVTAKMRAISKGVALHVDRNGAWREARTKEQDALILSYDRRLDKGKHYLSTAKGLPSFVATKKDGTQSYIFCLQYNYDRHPFREFISENNPFKDQITNFVPALINTDNFINAHNSLIEPFFKRMGFTLRSLLLFLQALSYQHILYRGQTSHPAQDEVIRVWSTLQRAYTATSRSPEELNNELIRLLSLTSTEVDYINDVTPANFLRICEYLTLSEEKKERLSLWSYGPRPVIFHHGDISVIDLGGILTFLSNLFFGIRENAQQRGLDFEELLRTEIEQQGYDLLPVRFLRRPDEKYRETDLAIRIGNNLVLCDCRTSERPLDWIIGKPSVIEKRNKLMQEKIEKVLSIKEFVCENLPILNGDYSWVQSVISLGVVTEVEWIDSQEERYWLDKDNDLPVLMSIQELLDFLEKLKAQADASRNIR
ncbi:hypothetical protein Q5705_01555 [Kosakonia sp. H02]|nr:hypothetical protein Q5705_01555 [Kosakonia sp. H02]